MIKTILAFPKIARNSMFKMESPTSNESTQSGPAPTSLFVLTVFFYVMYQLAMQPNWVLGGEMWAEMATNYFPIASSPSYFQKIFTTDAGYIPAPQRLIALTGKVFNLPASSIPYFYTWSAILLTGMMIGAFCMAQFRVVVKSDALRFFTAIAVLVVADFETRTFINFSYFAAFFVAIVTALALVNDSEEVPWWAWFIPILMVSKPAVLTAFPAMIIVAAVSKPRFRWITVVAAVLCIGQITQMVISQKTGMMPQTNIITFSSKLIASVKYFFGFLGGYVFGQNYQLNKYFSMLAGLLVFCSSGFVVFKKQNKAGSLIIIGCLLLFFNVLLNSFALSDSWNRDMARLAGLPVYRHIIVGFFGCILVVVGVFASLTDVMAASYKSRLFNSLGTVFFLIWFIATGWLSFGSTISREPTSPMLNSSQWQSMSKVIDSDEPVFCVPIDPFSWSGGIYGKNCSLLNPSMNMGQEYRAINQENNTYSFEFSPPAWVSPHYVISMGILVKPSTLKSTQIVAKASLASATGEHSEMFGERELPATGGLILLSGLPSSKITGVNSVKIEFNVPVEIRFITEPSNTNPAILWMGQAVSKVAKIYEGKIVHQPPQNRGKEDGLFLVQNGLRRWISSPDWITRNGFKPTDITQIDSSEFNSICEDPQSLQN